MRRLAFGTWLGWTGRLTTVSLVLAGCSDGGTANTVPASSITPSVQWSGGTVTARSAGFSGATLPLLYAGGTPLTLSRSDDTTLTLRLPVAASGDLVISRSASGHDTVGVVQVVGFDRSRSVPGTMGYEPLAPEGAPSLFFVAESLGSALSFLDPATDQVSYFHGAGPSASSFGIQPSFQDNRFVLRDSTGSLAVYRLLPSVALLDTSAVHNAVARHVVQLGDSAWLATFSNLLQSSSPAGQFSFQGLTNDPIRLVFSADRSRLAMSLYSSPGLHAPVIDAATGDTAYTMPIARPWGVAFAPHADRLYVSASTLQGDSVIAVRGSDGLRLGAVPLAAGWSGYTLSADAKADRLYQVAESSGVQALLIYNASTLDLVGHLGCSGACGNNYAWSAGIGVDTTANKIHIVYPGTPIPVITYDRLP